jgi:hypothetical protein
VSIPGVSPMNNLVRITTTDYSISGIIEPNVSTDLENNWCITLLEIDANEKSCKIMLHNQTTGEQKIFWVSESEYVKGIEYFGRTGLKIIEVRDNSIQFELYSGHTELNTLKNNKN